MRKIVKIMPDYDCYSTWLSVNDAIYENVDPKILHLSEGVIAKLDQWEIQYANTLNHENPSNSGFESKYDEEMFEKIGFEIWQNVISELKDCEVLFFSIIDNKIYSLEDYSNRS